MVLSLSHGNHTQWPVSIIIENLDTKIWESQKRPRTIFLGSIPIIHKGSENKNNKDRNLKAKIYYIALKTIL